MVKPHAGEMRSLWLSFFFGMVVNVRFDRRVRCWMPLCFSNAEYIGKRQSLGFSRAQLNKLLR